MIQVAAMLAVAASWLVLAIMFFGIGRLVCRTIGIGLPGWRQAHLSFWIGWATTVTALQVWHLWFAVSDIVLPAMLVVGFVGAALDGRILFTQARRSLRRASRNQIICGALVVLLVVGFWSSLALGPPLRPDTANYHLAGVRWSSTYAVIPGLGNLHGRLAFNNSSFLYAAMLDAGPWHHGSHHLAHGLLAVVTLLFLASRIPSALASRGRTMPVDLLLSTFFPVVILFTYKGTTSFQPDFITFLLGLIVSALLLELLCNPGRNPRKTAAQIFAIALLGSVGVTVKLSFLPMGFLACCIALVIGLQRANRGVSRGRVFVASCSAATIALVPWVVHGVMLSGYMAYPSSVGAIDVPWKVPPANVEHMQNAIVGYARHHGPGYLETLDNYDWVVPVITRELSHPISVTIPLVCTCLSLASLAIYRARKKQFIRPNANWMPWFFLIPSCGCVGLMILSAPVPRFAGAAIWLIAMGTTVLALDQLDRTSDKYKRARRAIAGLVAVLLCIGLVKASRYTADFGVKTAFAPMPVGDVELRETASGLRVYVAEEFAWDAPLPNSPEFSPQLSLMRPGQLSGGFRVESVTTEIASGETETSATFR